MLITLDNLRIEYLGDLAILFHKFLQHFFYQVKNNAQHEEFSAFNSTVTSLIISLSNES